MRDSVDSSEVWLNGPIAIHHGYGGVYRSRRYSKLSPDGLVLLEYQGSSGRGDPRILLRHSIDGKFMRVLGCNDQEDRLDKSLALSSIISGSSMSVRDVEFSENGRFVVVERVHKMAYEVWATDTGQLIHTLKRHVIISPNSEFMVVDGEEREVYYYHSKMLERTTLEVRHIETGSIVHVIDCPCGVHDDDDDRPGIVFSAIGFSPDGLVMATTCQTGASEFHFEFWWTRIWKCIGRYEPGLSRNHQLSWSADSRWIATTSGAGDEPSVQLLDGNTFEVERELRPFEEEPLVIFSPDNSMIATCMIGRGVVQLWSLDTGEQVWSTTLGPLIHSLVFSPDGSLIATRGVYSVTVLDVRTGKPIYASKDYDDGDTGVRFSPDGQLLILKGKNAKVQIVGPGQ